MERRLYNWFIRRPYRPTRAELIAEIERLELENSNQFQAIRSLQDGLAYAADPFNLIEAQEAIESGIWKDEGSVDWDAILEDIIESEGNGGASGSWND